VNNAEKYQPLRILRKRQQKNSGRKAITLTFAPINSQRRQRYIASCNIPQNNSAAKQYFYEHNE
jgi:hypothetical protein